MSNDGEEPFFKRVIDRVEEAFGLRRPATDDAALRPADPTVADDMKKIKHLVVLMMENRSFDQYLGSLSLTEGRNDVDGLTNPLMALPNRAGDRSYSSYRMVNNYYGFADPPHGWDPQHLNYQDPELKGFNRGFVKQYQTQYPNGFDPGPPRMEAPPEAPMGYYDKETLQVLYPLADRFCVCDRWFSSVLSSTWPNRKFLMSSQCDSDDDTEMIPPFPGFETTPFLDQLEDTPNPDTGRNCTWKCYFADLPFLGFWYPFAAFHALNSFATVADFVTDCRQDTLPTVSIIDPPFSLADDHPTHDIRLGQKFVGLIVDALSHSESWASTALVLLYDENGGFYDHVPPPAAFETAHRTTAPKFDRLGFRVPAIVISPYARRRAVAKVGDVKTVFDHTSIMKSIAVRWNVRFNRPGIGTRWQYAPDIWSSCFDFSQESAMGTYTQTPEDVANNVTPPFSDLDWGTGIHNVLSGPGGAVETFLNRIFILPDLKSLDHRSQVYDHLYNLENHTIALKRMASKRKAGVR
jgi:phospholipase C